MSLVHEIVLKPNVAVFSIQGRINTTEDAEVLIAALDQALVNKIHGLIINISALEYTSSSGLNFFIRALTRIRIIGGKLIICGISGNVEKLFVISKLNEIFTFCPTVEEGLKLINANKA